MKQICSNIKTDIRRIGRLIVVSGIALTIKDVCVALGGISRSRIHAWARLPPFSLTETFERSARRFSPADLLTLAALQTLEKQFGLRYRQLSFFSQGIHQYFIEPRTITPVEMVFIRLRDGRVLPLSRANEAGYLLDMAWERERINTFLGISSPQGELPLMSSIGVAGK